MSTRTQVLKILTDGLFHSGTAMGEQLKISRAAINKSINSLTEIGVEIHRVSGRGYRLADSYELLDKKSISENVADPHFSADKLHLLDRVDSTSSYLLSLAERQSISAHVCIAEAQSEGRGRRGRVWQANPYQNILMSIAWQFNVGIEALSGLSLAAGVAIVQTLRAIGIDHIGLKWPNDLVSESGKVGGILIDVKGEASGPCLLVLGVGINMKITEKTSSKIDQEWTDISRLTGHQFQRNKVAGLLISRLTELLNGFANTGFESYRQEWEALHIYNGKSVRLFDSHNEYCGHVEGVDNRGALRIRQQNGQYHLFNSGEISIRPVDGAVS